MKNVDAMVEAIVGEIKLQKGFLKEELRTIYFGGGTPSILSPQQLGLIVSVIDECFGNKKVEEITVEANPEDISSDLIDQWQAAGINRVSLGIQTLHNAVLQELNRAHTGEQALNSIQLIQNGGIENITIDLMYGLPGQGLKDWQDNLEKIINMNIPHLSAYALTFENKTAFGQWQKKGLIRVIEDEEYEEQYQVMCEILGKAGYEHYEVSNFARPGFRSRHNQLYWQGVKYLGVGPGAHSFDGRVRYFNISNNAGYIRSIKNGELPAQSETLSEDEQFNEYLLTRLRTTEGISFDNVKSRFDVSLKSDHQKYIGQCIENKLAYLEADSFRLTEKGFFVSDAIILELMK